MAKAKKSSRKRGKNHAIELSAKAAFFWGLCLFFLLAWIFVLGIFVGRGFVPNGMQSISQMKAQISKLQGLIGHRGSSNPETPKRSFEDPKLAFYENLSTKKKAVARSQPSPERKLVQEKPVDRGEIRAKKLATRENTPVHTTGSFTVQIASLGVQEKAKALAKTLTTKGYPAYFYAVKVKGTPRYRVRCGSFKTAEEAKGFAQELFKAEKIKGFVLRAEK
jgi:cell division septation protein DedD